MLITKIEPGRNKRYRIFGDDRFLFALYGKELKRYEIEENQEVSDLLISSIREDVVYKRAKERAFYLLERRPLTASMLGIKLRDNDYPDDVIEDIILFLESYHYLDDKDYVRMYVEAYSGKKSRKQMLYDLLRKGVSRELIDAYFEEAEYSEQESLLRLFTKYTKGKDLDDPLIRQKVFRYFYGKGFDTSLIEMVLDIMHKNR